MLDGHDVEEQKLQNIEFVRQAGVENLRQKLLKEEEAHKAFRARAFMPGHGLDELQEAG